MFPRGAMPMVQRLQFSVRAWDVAGGGGLGWDDLRMDHLPSLEEVYVELWYRKDGDEVQHVAAALRREADGHPNRPTLRVKKGSGARACIYQYHGPSWPSGFWIFSPNHALYSYVSKLPKYF
jgi:hypothetical protein